MAELPIMFSGPMVRAILDGRKTVTRRLVKPLGAVELSDRHLRGVHAYHDGDLRAVFDHADDEPIGVRSPYGKPGDQLWVRETWGLWRSGRGSWLTESVVGVHRGVLDTWTVAFRADGEADGARWRPSIHMPRWASRITLDVVAVSVERLHDITEEDAAREGVEPMDGLWANYMCPPEPAPLTSDAIGSFASLWEHINGAGSWAANPWVWRVEFRRTK